MKCTVIAISKSQISFQSPKVKCLAVKKNDTRQHDKQASV